jgi:hypothetical protein
VARLEDEKASPELAVTEGLGMAPLVNSGGLGVVLRYLWAAPCTVVGVLMAAPMLLCGARARGVRGVLEVSGGVFARWLPFEAITLGHVVLARTPRAMRRLRRHERVHVRQCECWGPAFFAAYLLAGAWQWLHGRRAYWDNPFEVQARQQALRTGDCE